MLICNKHRRGVSPTKILKSNGQFVCRSTMRRLTDDERACPVHAKMHKSFDTSVLDAIEPSATAADFPAEDLTPTYEHYDDDIFGHNPNYGDIEVKPETRDTFLGVEILLPRGGVLTKARVTSQKRDVDGNLKGTANDNPILDTHEYVVTFDDGDMTDLTANLIAASM